MYCSLLMIEAAEHANLPLMRTSQGIELPLFTPHRALTAGHLQTIVGNYWRRPHLDLKHVDEELLVDPSDGSRIRCRCHWQPEDVRASRFTAVLVHGLEGSVNSGYIRGLTARAWAMGWNVIRMNMRNCGGTEELTPTLYHSGLSCDVSAILAHFGERYNLTRFGLIGYSMGGNLVLKTAGEWGAQRPLCAVAAVCPAVDLAPGSDALHEPQNRAYEWHFLRGLMARFRRKAALFPQIYKTEGIGPVRSIREFDNKILARYWGFRDADDYYFRAAAARVIDGIRVPTLILQAQDDPFIRLTDETRARILDNPAIHFVEPLHGGHCAFLARAQGEAVHWAEEQAIAWLAHVARAHDLQ